MDFLLSLRATELTPLVMAMFYLIIIYWLRRPERLAEREAMAQHQATA